MSGSIHKGRTRKIIKEKIMNDTEIRIKGIETLNKNLGPAPALKFFTLLNREYTDYVEISKRLV